MIVKSRGALLVQSSYTKDERSVVGTPEATYVAGLKWEWDGFHYVVRETTEQVRTKIGEIFQKWGIGWHARKDEEAKKGYISVYVTKRQFDRVKFDPGVKDANADRG